MMVISYRDVMHFLKENEIETPAFGSELWWLHNSAYHVACRFNNKALVELGTLNGASAIAMGAGIAQAKKQLNQGDAKLITVDNYFNFHNKSRPGLSSPDDIVKAVAKAGLDSVVQVVESDDAEFISTLPDFSVSMMYHDADHRYDPLTKSLIAGLPKMVEGALYCGDDYCFRNQEVVFAVEDFRESYPDLISGFGLVDQIWWFIVRQPFPKMPEKYIKKGSV